MRSDRIISALSGLIGACNSNPKTGSTDKIVLKALAFANGLPDGDESTVQEIISEILNEKNRIAPNCAFCATPCGNTSDYDMSLIYNAEDGIRSAKLQILSEIQDMSAYIYNSADPDRLLEDAAGILYKALIYVSFDLEEKELLAVLSEVAEINRYVRSIDHAEKNCKD